MNKSQGKIDLEKETQGEQGNSYSPCLKAPSFYSHIPNLLTILRIVGAPLSVWFITQNQLVVAFWIFFAVSTTDWLDGYLARRWEVTSKLGQILDPIADKLLIMSVYLALGLWKFIPIWLTALVLSRDLLILLSSSSIILTKKVVMDLAPNFIGKISTTAQMLFVGFVLARGVPVPSIPTSSIENNLMVFFLYSVAFLTILSGITYARMALGAFRKS